MTVSGGSGSGAVTVSTDEGCTARLKDGESNIYLVYVYPLAGKSYSVSVNKAGDATYDAATPQTVTGTTSGVAQSALAVDGWKDSAYSGDAFEIRLAGGSGSGALNFELSGCKVTPTSGTLNDTYTVTVTAPEGEAYSLKVSHAGDGNYMPASAAYNGKAKLFETDDDSKQILVDDEPVATSSYSWLYICGGIVLLLGIVLLTMQALNAPRRRRRR